MNVLVAVRQEYLAQTLQMMFWVRRGLVLIVVVQIIAILATQTLTLIPNMAATCYCICIVSLIIAFCQQQHVGAATFAMLFGLLSGSILVLVVAPSSLTVIAVAPAMACAALAPFTSRKTLLQLSIGAMVCFAVLSAWNLFVQMHGNAVWYDTFQLYLGINLIVGISVALIWLAHSRFAAMLSRFVAANNELMAIKATLESQVQARTNESARSIEMLRATLEATADGIMLNGTDYAPIIWNQKFSEMWRISDQFLSTANSQDRLKYMSEQLVSPESFLASLAAIRQNPTVVSEDTISLLDGRVFERYSQPQMLEGHGLSRVWSVRDVTQRVRAERRANVFAALGLALSATVSVEDAARTIIETADELLGWDSAYLDFYNPVDESLETILCIDTIDGTRTEIPPPPASTLSFDEHRILRRGASLVLRAPTDPDLGDFVPFGDLARPSASLMFVPIHRGSSIIGVVSIQSYTHNTYTDEDLITFQSLANHCAGALERNRTEAALRRAGEERQHLERKMLETQKLESLGVMAGGIAHDFNNLLAVILGNINLAQIEADGNAQLNHSLLQVETATRRAADLTRQMLAYSGKGQFVIQQIAINDLISEMGELLSASMPKQVRFSYDFQPDLPMICGDATQLRQVCMNILVNAAEAIGQSEGNVGVQTTLLHANQAVPEPTIGKPLAAGDYVAITVTDSGCGMEESIVRSMFDPFFSTKFAGRGLGLAAVLGIVRGHQGTVQVDSKLGAGTTFRVLLPVANTPQEAAMAATPIGQPAANDTWHGSGVVLVVDDEVTVLRLVARMLEHCGFRSILANNGSEGLACFQQHAPELTAVFLDLTMPDMHGQQVLALMREFNPHVPVVLMSGYAEQSLLDGEAEQAHYSFMHKPFRLQHVRDLLQHMTSGASSRTFGT